MEDGVNAVVVCGPGFPVGLDGRALEHGHQKHGHGLQSVERHQAINEVPDRLPMTPEP